MQWQRACQEAQVPGPDSHVDDAVAKNYQPSQKGMFVVHHSKTLKAYQCGKQMTFYIIILDQRICISTVVHIVIIDTSLVIQGN